jgi:hypothetical protein
VFWVTQIYVKKEERPTGSPPPITVSGICDLDSFLQPRSLTRSRLSFCLMSCMEVQIFTRAWAFSSGSWGKGFQ